MKKSCNQQARSAIMPIHSDELANIAFSKKDDGVTSYTKKLLLFQRQGGTCVGCSAAFPMGEMTKHHILPKAVWVDNRMKNICLLCEGCHAAVHRFGKTTKSQWHGTLKNVLVWAGFDENQRSVLYRKYRKYAMPKRATPPPPALHYQLQVWETDGGR